MKKFLTVKQVAFAGLLVLGISLAGCQQDSNFYQYPFKTAKITYQITGSSTGTSEVFIKDDKKMIKDNIVKKSVDGKEEKLNRITIVDPEKIYILDVDKKTGVSFKNSAYEEFKKLDPNKRQEKLLMNALQQDAQGSATPAATPKPEGSEQIAGQKCDSYKVSYATNCLWYGVPLKSMIDIEMYGLKTETIATKIELDQNIDDNTFKAPADFKIEEQK